MNKNKIVSAGATCSRVWTREEIATIKKHSGKKTISEIALLLGRTREATRVKAISLGIKMQQYGENHRLATYPDSIVETARRMHEDGFRPKIIADELKVKIKTVEGWIYFRGRLNDPVKIR